MTTQHDDETSSMSQQPAGEVASNQPTPVAIKADNDDVLDIIDDVDRQLQRIREARKHQDEQLGSLAKRLEEVERAESELAAARTQIEQREQTLAEASQATQAAQADLKKQQKDLAKREADVQKQRAEIDQQRDEISGRLTQAETNVGDLMRQVESLHEQIQEKSSLLEASNRQCSELTEQLAERDATITKQRSKLELARKKIEEYSSALAEQAEQVEKAAGAAAILTQQEQTIAKLKKQLAESSMNASSEQDELLSQRDQRIEHLEKALAQQTQMAVSAADTSTLVKQQQQEIETLKRRLAENSKHASDVQSEQLKQRDERIAELEKALAATTNAKTKAAVEDQQSRMAAIEALNRKSQIVAAQQEALAQTEAAMMRRWARPKAVVLTGWIILIACVLAAGSWLAMEQFVPEERTASVTVSPQPTSSPLTPEQIKQWQDMHTAILYDAGFINLLARRYAEQRLDGRATGSGLYSDPKSLAGLLDARLAILPAASGELVIVLTDHDVKRLTVALDTIASTLATESARQLGRSGGSDSLPAAVARRSPSPDGRTQYAIADPWQLSTDRITLVAIVFGVSLVVTMALVIFTYTRLLCAKRVLDEEAAQFA